MYIYIYIYIYIIYSENNFTNNIAYVFSLESSPSDFNGLFIYACFLFYTSHVHNSRAKYLVIYNFFEFLIFIMLYI